MSESSREHVPCPVCRADQPTHALTASEFLFGQGEAFDIVRCGQCNLLYTNPRPTTQALGQYYPDHYYRHEVKPKENRPARQTGWRERWTQTALRCHLGYPGHTSWAMKLLTWPRAWRLKRGMRDHDALPWVGEGRLLDFGCGDARFLRLQRDRGWNVAGVDFNETVARWAREEDGLDVVAGTWPGDAMAGRQFDVITAWHVVEHLPDPTAWVAAAVERLAPGGMLLICCPDADSWAFERFGPFWFGLDVPRHFSQFTKHDLAKLMRHAGLTVTRIRPQHRSRPLKESVRMFARHNGSSWWRFLSKRSLLWRIYGYFAALSNKADCVIVIGKKPAA